MEENNKISPLSSSSSFNTDNSNIQPRAMLYYGARVEKATGLSDYYISTTYGGSSDPFVLMASSNWTRKKVGINSWGVYGSIRYDNQDISKLIYNNITQWTELLGVYDDSGETTTKYPAKALAVKGNHLSSPAISTNQHQDNPNSYDGILMDGAPLFYNDVIHIYYQSTNEYFKINPDIQGRAITLTSNFSWPTDFVSKQRLWSIPWTVGDGIVLGTWNVPQMAMRNLKIQRINLEGSGSVLVSFSFVNNANVDIVVKDTTNTANVWTVPANGTLPVSLTLNYDKRQLDMTTNFSDRIIWNTECYINNTRFTTYGWKIDLDYNDYFELQDKSTSDGKWEVWMKNIFDKTMSVRVASITYYNGSKWMDATTSTKSFRIIQGATKTIICQGNQAVDDGLPIKTSLVITMSDDIATQFGIDLEAGKLPEPEPDTTTTTTTTT